MGLDEAGVVVALHLEDGGLTIPDIDDACVFTGSTDDPGRFGGQGLQPQAARFVGTMFVPHGRKDTQFRDVGLTPDDLQDLGVFLSRQPVFGNDVGRQLAFRAHDRPSTMP